MYACMYENPGMYVSMPEYLCMYEHVNMYGWIDVGLVVRLYPHVCMNPRMEVRTEMYVQKSDGTKPLYMTQISIDTNGQSHPYDLYSLHRVKLQVPEATPFAVNSRRLHAVDQRTVIYSGIHRCMHICKHIQLP